MDDRDRAEHQRLISISEQARKQAQALLVSSRDAIARAYALIECHAARRATERPSVTANGRP
jgi:hypothetical protein